MTKLYVTVDGNKTYFTDANDNAVAEFDTTKGARLVLLFIEAIARTATTKVYHKITGECIVGQIGDM